MGSIFDSKKRGPMVSTADALNAVVAGKVNGLTDVDVAIGLWGDSKKVGQLRAIVRKYVESLPPGDRRVARNVLAITQATRKVGKAAKAPVKASTLLALAEATAREVAAAKAAEVPSSQGQ